MSLVADFRTFGVPAALIRSSYEVGKRTGVQGKLLTARLGPAPWFASTGCSGDLPTGHPAKRCTGDASGIAGGKAQLFARMVAVGSDPDWHGAVDTGGHWPALPWWRIDLRREDRPGDVKWAWELGRHRHLVVLARAAALEPEQPQWLETLQAQLNSWLEANPTEIGIHWYSNLELALRSLAWLQILSLTGDRLDRGLRQRMADTLYHTGRHMVLELPYTVSSMRNNHLLGDALGLIAIGRSFPADRRARRWAKLGGLLFARQLARQVRDDGSMIEDSLSYHRFVLEMLAVRVVLGGRVAEVRQRLHDAAQLLVRLGALEGAVPAHGDWDEGRVLTTSGDPSQLRGSVRLALALAGSGAPQAWAEEDDEVAWYATRGVPAPAEPPERRGKPVGGGLARAEVGGARAWLKMGSAPSHGHADLSSVTLSLDGVWVVGDPGTGSYNGDPAQRSFFRSSVGHSVLRLDGQDQLVEHRAFRWVHQATGRVGPPLTLGGGHLMWGVHDAYRRLTPPRRVARVAVLTEGALTVADWVEGPPGIPWSLALPLGPHASWREGEIHLPSATVLGVDLPGPARSWSGSLDPYRGWWSPTYGSAQPSTWLEVTGLLHGPVCWSLRWSDTPGADVDQGGVRLGPDHMSIEWHSDGVLLQVVGRDGRVRAAEVGLTS